ncbi:hypothetical protein D3C72_2346910 [compost metagenome]
MINLPATCDAFGCVTAKSNAEQIELSRDNPWTVETDLHGICDFYQASYAIDAQGRLLQKQNVYNCQDSFMGLSEKALPRLN